MSSVKEELEAVSTLLRGQADVMDALGRSPGLTEEESSVVQIMLAIASIDFCKYQLCKLMDAMRAPKAST